MYQPDGESETYESHVVDLDGIIDDLEDRFVLVRPKVFANRWCSTGKVVTETQLSPWRGCAFD